MKYNKRMDKDKELLQRVKHLEQALEEIKQIIRDRDKAYQRCFLYRLVKTLKKIFLGV